jgi:hypothetical protein
MPPDELFDPVALATRGAAGETVILYGSAAQLNEQAAGRQRECRERNNADVDRESADEYERRCPPPQPLTEAQTTYLHERGLLNWRPPAPTSHAAASAGAPVRTRLARARAPRRQPRRSRTRVTRGSPAGAHSSGSDDPDPPLGLRVGPGTWLPITKGGCFAASAYLFLRAVTA